MKFVINLVCMFIPFRTMRKNVREFLKWRVGLTFRHMFVARRKYDYIYSMGDVCFVAYALNKAGLRRCSGPFDWIGSSDGVMVPVRALLAGAAHWFDRADFCANADGVVMNRRTGFICPHDIPSMDSFDKYYPAARDKLQRRFERMLGVLNRPGRVLLIFSAESEPDMPTLHTAIARLREHFAAEIELMYVTRSDAGFTAPTVYDDGVTVCGTRRYVEWRGNAHRLATLELIRHLAYAKIG